MLATTSIGAIWSSCGPDFGTRGVLDRFSQLAPKLMFCVDGYSTAASRSTAAPRWRRSSTGCRRSSTSSTAVSRPGRPRGRCAAARCSGTMLVARHDARTQRFEFEQVPFDAPAVDPVLVGHDGPAQADRARPRRHHDRADEEPAFPHGPACPASACSSSRRTGWMMWNFLASAPAVGRRAGALRRQPGAGRTPDAAVEDGRADRASASSARARPTSNPREGGHRAAGTLRSRRSSRPSCSPVRRSRRNAALVLREREARPVGAVRQRRHGRLQRLRAAAS